MKQPLTQLSNNLRNQLVVLQCIVALTSVAMFFGLRFLVPVLPSVCLAALFFLILSVVLAHTWTNISLLTTRFLVQAIMHVASEASPEPPPDPDKLHAEKAYFESVATTLYDLVSESVLTNKSSDAGPLFDIKRNTPLPYLIMSKDGVIFETSNSFLTYINKQPGQCVGQQINDVCKLFFTSEDTLDNWISFAAEKALTLSRNWDRVKITLDDGTAKQFDMAAHYVKDAPNGADIVVAFFDHTERYSRDDSGASLVAMAVHELRTPLTVMRGYIEVFEEELADKLNPEQAEFMRNLTAQAQQLTSFVNNIQNLARIQDNSLELVLKQENWTEILNTTLANLELRARTRRRSLSYDIPSNLPMVAVDRSTISEVIVNIVENAIKYTHTDSPINIETYLKDDQWIETIIVDKGIGIPDSLIGHVFDKFYRSHRTSRSVGGTGLGLYISKSIVDAHGGQIWVKSKEGEGSTFGFTIPTYESVKDQVQNKDNGGIIRGAHGWIKNHSLYRG